MELDNSKDIFDFHKIKNILNDVNNIIISAHVNPDADSVGSCTALALALKKLNKNIVILMEDYGTKYDFLNNNIFMSHNLDDISNFQKDLFICLDCGDKERLGTFKTLLDNSNITINIDHHISNTNFAKYNYVFEKSSTCEIVYELILYLNIELDDNVAKALYTGILADTGGFRHSNTTSTTHEIVAKLIKYNFSADEIYKELFDTNSYESIKLLGQALIRTELFYDGKVAYSYITQNDIKQLNANTSQLGGIIDNLKNIKGVVVAVFIYEKNGNEFKVSMRSDGSVDICKIAISFGGGGHFKACGCTINGNSDEVKNLIFKKLEF